MSNEHMQHRQCQICFVVLQTNPDLRDHIEEYRYREHLLVAELERCRKHLPQSFDINSESDDDYGCDKEENGHVSVARPSQLHCPFGGCDRQEPFTTRGNLLRHFQKHVQCYEMCPFCEEIIKQVHRFMRHECKESSDKPKDTYTQCRISQLNKMASKELDQLQGFRSHTRKRVRGQVDCGSKRARKIVKTPAADTCPKPHHCVDYSVPADSELTCPSETMKVTATNNTSIDGIYIPTAGMVPSNNAELNFSSEIGISANGGGQAFTETASAIPMNAEWPELLATDGEWAFYETAQAMPSNGLWAFA